MTVIQDGVLSRELVQSGLSDLGRTGDGIKMTYLTLSLSVSQLSYMYMYMN